jgi:hypothetical protein
MCWRCQVIHSSIIIRKVIDKISHKCHVENNMDVEMLVMICSWRHRQAPKRAARVHPCAAWEDLTTWDMPRCGIIPSLLKQRAVALCLLVLVDLSSRETEHIVASTCMSRYNNWPRRNIGDFGISNIRLLVNRTTQQLDGSGVEAAFVTPIQTVLLFCFRVLWVATLLISSSYSYKTCIDKSLLYGIPTDTSVWLSGIVAWSPLPFGA